jgi:hypothetical protein
VENSISELSKSDSPSMQTFVLGRLPLIPESRVDGESASSLRLLLTTGHHGVGSVRVPILVGLYVYQQDLSDTQIYTELSSSKGPSTALMKSLLSLSASIQHLGISRDPSRLGHAANDTLRLFVIELLGDAATGWRSHERQALWDLAFLRKLADLWVDGWTKTSGLLDKTMAQILGKVCTEIFFVRFPFTLKCLYSSSFILTIPQLSRTALQSTSRELRCFWHH